jgi:hypothetical protein
MSGWLWLAVVGAFVALAALAKFLKRDPAIRP